MPILQVESQSFQSQDLSDLSDLSENQNLFDNSHDFGLYLEEYQEEIPLDFDNSHDFPQFI